MLQAPLCGRASYWANHAAPKHPDDLAATIASSTRALDRPFFVVFHRCGTTGYGSCCGQSRANDGGVLRQWALDGHGVIMRNDLDIRKGLPLAHWSPLSTRS